MEKEKFWKWTALGLFLLNLVMLFSLYKKREVPRDKQLAPFMMQHLSLTEEQRKAYKISVDKHRAGNNILLEQEKITSNELLNLMLSNQVDSIGYEKSIRELTDIRMKIIKNNFSHFYELRKNCVPEQQKEFDKVIAEVIDKMNNEKKK